MIKVYAGIASVGFLLISGAAGCSSANTPDDGEGGTGSGTTAGTTSTSGSTSIVAGMTSSTGGSSAGMTSATAGTTSSTAGTTSSTAGTGSGTGGTSGVPLECKGTKSGMACTAEGVDCQGLACGIADSGVRACKCMGTWMCAACDFTNSPFKTKPDPIGTCTNEADKLECATEGMACEGAPGGEVCVCFRDDEGSLIWDCDKAPPTWAAPAM